MDPQEEKDGLKDIFRAAGADKPKDHFRSRVMGEIRRLEPDRKPAPAPSWLRRRMAAVWMAAAAMIAVAVVLLSQSGGKIVTGATGGGLSDIGEKFSAALQSFSPQFHISPLWIMSFGSVVLLLLLDRVLRSRAG